MILTIKKAELENIPQLIELLREFAAFENLSEFCTVSADDLRGAIFGEDRFVQCLVAFEGKICVGYAMFFPVFKTFRGERSMYLEDLYVSPQMRGKGFGFALLKEVARIAKAQNCVRMDWQALKWNTPALEFYKNLGAESDDENLDFRLRETAFENLAG